MNATILAESFTCIAKHYSDKITASGLKPSEAQLKAAVQANWPKMVSEAVRLHDLVIIQLATA